MIRLRGIEKTYKNGSLETHVLKGIDLDILAGEYIALMGTSGTGKSTLMNILGCLDRSTGGTYEFDEVDITTLSDEGLSILRNEKIGFVFQQFHLLPKASALANVMLPLVYARDYPKDARTRAEGLLGLVGLHERMHHLPGQLSGGQQQRVAIARAMVMQPRLILADEPTGNLDRNSSKEVMQIFQRLHERGITIVMVTHDEETASHSKRILRMVDGRIVSDSSCPNETTSQPVTESVPV